ncbi:MAG: DUF2283 domain-containing protein [Ignavibacteriales bacterium]|nr:DUF2283 domain-containing protein [Ignavibacteriales bacterium]
MNFKYDPETDSLYIHLNRSRSVKTIRVSAHIQIDLGKDGTPVGINLENVSDYIDMYSGKSEQPDVLDLILR